MNYYNEFDPKAASWLRNLIADGLIPPGDVDERSIEDVRPCEISGYTQCHFFAGIGGWPLALRLAGWPAHRPVWTGSCPCQPFSTAGKGAGFDDERHLWPSFQWLIEQCRPTAVFGEQVAASTVGSWVDLVQADLEALDYAFGCVAFPAAGVGAPHIRDRIYWIGSRLANPRGERQPGPPWVSQGREHEARADGHSDVGRMGYASGQGLEERECVGRVPGGAPGGSPGQTVERAGIHPGGVADAGRERLDRVDSLLQWQGARRIAGDCMEIAGGGQTAGFWGSADWLYCRDYRWRPVEPGTFPLADGVPNRVVRLRGYGNAIVPPAAAEFIKAAMECMPWAQ